MPPWHCSRLQNVSKDFLHSSLAISPHPDVQFQSKYRWKLLTWFSFWWEFFIIFFQVCRYDCTFSFSRNLCNPFSKHRLASTFENRKRIFPPSVWLKAFPCLNTAAEKVVSLNEKAGRWKVNYWYELPRSKKNNKNWEIKQTKSETRLGIKFPFCGKYEQGIEAGKITEWIPDWFPWKAKACSQPMFTTNRDQRVPGSC